jgi:hypothetical protein
MPKEKPCCETGPRWVRERLKDRTALAPLTGQDWPAFAAFFHLVTLWGNADQNGRDAAIAAMYHTVRAMQPSMQPLAKSGIPHVLDWSHEDQIWRAIEEYGFAYRLAVSSVEGATA